MKVMREGMQRTNVEEQLGKSGTLTSDLKKFITQNDNYEIADRCLKALNSPDKKNLSELCAKEQGEARAIMVAVYIF